MSVYYCVYDEYLVTSYDYRHSRQFKESIDGTRYPMFPDGQADILIDDDGNYRVLTTHKEVLYVGAGKASTEQVPDAWGDIVSVSISAGEAGLAEAVRRINHAQPGVEITVRNSGRAMITDN